jgi:hypothetical protein
MGEQTFRVQGDSVDADALKVGASSGSMSTLSVNSDQWAASATAVPSTAHLNTKTTAGITAGPSVKFATRKEHASGTKRGINYQLQGNYSSLWYGQLAQRAEAVPIYIPHDIVITGCAFGGRALTSGGVASHNRYFCFYSAGGYTGTKRRYPSVRKGWMKANVGTLSQNSFSNFNDNAMDDGTEGNIFDDDGVNVTGIPLTAGWYWFIMVADTDSYTAASPATSVAFGCHAAGSIMSDSIAWRPPYQLQTTSGKQGNSIGLKSTASAWQPTTSSTFTPPANITVGNWSEWDRVSDNNGTSGYWHTKVLLYGDDS